MKIYVWQKSFDLIGWSGCSCQKGNSKKAWKPKINEKKWEEFESTRRILYHVQNSRREFEASTSRKEDKRKKPKKIGLYFSSQKEEKRKKEAEKGKYLLHKFIF